ncbi:MAG: large conductance mechanosensitive channel [Acidimicrobiaceae bacterium]|jgi:large conductance mechanosensitive channel|nr:large conductance mechanosensitive channel [Acidimicrobiaceae bacterium]MDQ1445999.1 large conductance mechanosensitive channel [Acidimicrobiaceae bacterium]
MFKEFKQFLFRGNLLDLATAVIIGVAFNTVVQSLVRDVVTPLIAAIGGRPDFDFLTLKVGDGVLKYGTFFNALFNFVIVAAVMFAILKAAAKAQRLRASTDVPSDEAVPPSDEAMLLAEIRDILRTRA